MVVRILRRREVERMTGLPRSTIYHYIETQDFPRPIALGPRTAGWVEAEVAAWLEARIASQRPEAA